MTCGPAFKGVVHRVAIALLAANLGALLSGRQPSPVSTEAVARACENLDGTEVAFVGRAGKPFVHRLSFEKEIEPARRIWLAAQAASDRSPKNIDLLRKAIEAHDAFENIRLLYPDPHNYVLTPMRVETAFRGVAADNVLVELRETPPLEVGHSYLVYGERYLWMFGSDIVTSTQPKPVSDAQQELRLLRAALSSPHGGSVFGVIELEHALDLSRSSPLEGVNIRLSRPGYFDDTLTLEDGSFIVTGIPNGPVTISPSLPERLTIANRASLSTVVSDGGCFPVRLRAALNGRIRGRVVGPDGKARPNVRIQLLPVNSPRSYGHLPERFTRNTNEHGEFEFLALPPGSYLLGHNLYSESHVILPTAKKEPATYYPGTPDRRAAVPVLVGEGTEHNGFNFTLAH